MQQIIHPAFYIIKKYYWLLLIFLIGGNALHYAATINNQAGYEYNVSAKTSAALYSSVNNVFKSVAEKNKSDFSIQTIESNSIRSENGYECNLIFQMADTNYLMTFVNEIKKQVESDSALIRNHFSLVSRYADFKSRYDKLLSESQQSDSSLEVRTNLLDIEANLSTLSLQILAIANRLTIDYPAKKNFSYVNSKSSAKGYLIATILFLLIGFSFSIVADQFRKKPAA
jgi:hypothetical protein